jgi:alkylation response protein AidB-like acyl-CoA dehydrogenase
LREWLAEHVPEPWPHVGLMARGPVDDEIDEDAYRARYKAWRRLTYDSGYQLQTWPKEWGGGGLSSIYDSIFNDEAGRVGAPMLAPMHLERGLMAAGTKDQRERFLEPTMTGEMTWCQGFSEPSGGSDLASLRTRAVKEHDAWVVNGQKLWTSGAIHSDWCFLLVRTDPDVPKHAGISILLVDMTSPGVVARGVRTTDGHVHTAEVFFDDVVVPDENMLGAPGSGWPVAMQALAYERGPGDIGIMPDYMRDIEHLEARLRDHVSVDDQGTRRAIAKAYVYGQAMDLDSIKQRSLRVSGMQPGAEGSVTKLLWALAVQEIAHVEMKIVGSDAITGVEPGWVSSYFRSRPVSVYGGTEQIQRDLLAQRVMGMPRRARGERG